MSSPAALLVAAAALGATPPSLEEAPRAAPACAVVDAAGLVAGAEAVVVSEVERSSDSGALLVVEEVWAGPDRPPRLEVRTGDGDPLVFFEGDIRLVRGARYLVVLSDGAPPSTGACSVLRLDDGTVGAAELAAARPADARGPMATTGATTDATTGGGAAGDTGRVTSVDRAQGPPWLPLTGAAVVLGALAAVLVRWRARRHGGGGR